MRATLTRYSVTGWGEGELWMRGLVVVAHDFSYLDSPPPADDDRVGPPPPMGAVSPPLGTLAGQSSRGGYGNEPTSRQELVSTSHRRVAPLQPENRRDEDTPADELAGRIAHYLGGKDVPFDDVDLDLSWATPFQHAVADALRAIPRGEVVSYGELAALAGYPGAARAVGSFCARNRFALLVPCHRVVGAGGLGGYGATGVEVKRRLLALEGVVS